MSQGALYTTENCSGIVGQSTAKLVLQGASIGTTVAGSVGQALAMMSIGTGPLMPIVALAGGVISLFGAIFGAHAKKVQQEQQIICAVVQSINDSLSVIDQALQQGALTPQQANGSLDQLYTELQQNVQPILKQDSSHCNAACFILAEARGVIAKRKDQYSRIVPANAPPGSYVQTCRYMTVNGDTLTAQCEDTQGNWQQTTLPGTSGCVVIDNRNGVLTCTPTSGATPAASSAQPGTAAAPGATFDPTAFLTGSLFGGIPNWVLLAGALLLLKD